MVFQQVMRFAEVAMEVEVARPRPLIDIGTGMTPGRRKANILFKQAREKILTDGRHDFLKFFSVLKFS